MFLNYFAFGSADLRLSGDFLWNHHNNDIPYLIAKKRNHPMPTLFITGGLGEPVYSACYLAVYCANISGDALSTGAWLGMQSHVASQEKATDPEIASLF